jgi:hypothetical protein
MAIRPRYAACRTHLRPPSFEVNTFLLGALPVSETATRIVPSGEWASVLFVWETLTTLLKAKEKYQ